MLTSSSTGRAPDSSSRFCSEAGRLLSREDFGPDPAVAVNEEMNELSQLLEGLPVDDQQPVLRLIEHVQERFEPLRTDRP